MVGEEVKVVVVVLQMMTILIRQIMATFLFFRPTYWVVCIFFYAVALCLANLANLYELTIAGVKGQPALMWIDPLLIIPTILIAKSRDNFMNFGMEHLKIAMME